MKFRPAVFTEIIHIINRTKRSWGRQTEQLRAKCSGTSEADPGTKMPSCSLKKELHHLHSSFTDKKTWKSNHCENTS